MLLNGEVLEKKKRSIKTKMETAGVSLVDISAKALTSHDVGAECAEPIVITQSKPIKTKVNRKSVKLIRAGR